MRRTLAFTALTLLGACAQGPVPDAREQPAVLLLGEQHDAADHARLQREWVQALAGRRQLAALAIEMAEQGTSTAGLAAQADEAAVRAALRWNEQAWPWPRYREPVMAAVRAGVPVLGANLPRAQMRAAMADVQLEALLPGGALQAQQQAIRLGHCDLLPEPQIAPMTRIQIARDRAMAETVMRAAMTGRTVLLIAGAGHVDEALGVPRHLPAALDVRALRLPPVPVAQDPCDDLRRQLAPPRGAAGASPS
jgi:uncharacterized iron-regulated protein